MLVDSDWRSGNPAVLGVRGRGETGSFGDLLSGRGNEEELSRASTTCKSRREGLGLSSGCRRTDCEELALFNELARAGFDSEASPPGGALDILPESLTLVLADAVAVVLLRAILCCAWPGSDGVLSTG